MVYIEDINEWRKVLIDESEIPLEEIRLSLTVSIGTTVVIIATINTTIIVIIIAIVIHINI